MRLSISTATVTVRWWGSLHRHGCRFTGEKLRDVRVIVTEQHASETTTADRLRYTHHYILSLLLLHLRDLYSKSTVMPLHYSLL
eukprot:scaffold11118_cov229-Skeletonema_marinoi.AAC.3